MGLVRVHFPSNMNETAKLLKVKVDPKLRWSLLGHVHAQGPKWRKQQQSPADREDHPPRHSASFLLRLRLGDGDGGEGSGERNTPLR